ncbi:MAG: MBL fold metallo-hydrolase [Candidatus Lokiarchaeota archaeon]
MNFPNIHGLNIIPIPGNIFLLKQLNPPFRFSCSDGLLILPMKGRNRQTIVLDANVEPRFVNKINKIYGPISDYICSHGHMDHIAHVHQWERIGAKIHAPKQEASNLLQLKKFYDCYGINKSVSYKDIEKFGKLNKYLSCGKVLNFNPGTTLEFENLKIKTIPLTAHSISHVGFYLKNERLLHISCLGFDKKGPEEDGFGPWYGFQQCSLKQYLKDIQYAMNLYQSNCKTLTSSHSYVVEKNDLTPFDYMRRKIKENHLRIQKSLKNSTIILKKEKTENVIQKLLKKDMFFPKEKMTGFFFFQYYSRIFE